MKKILLTFILTISASTAFAEVYFCSDKDAVGFKTPDNYKVTTFTKNRFQVNIDFIGQTIKSDAIHFTDAIEKKCVSWEHELYCIAATGTVFSINLKTGDYRTASTIVTDIPEDDIVLRYGTCEKF